MNEEFFEGPVGHKVIAFVQREEIDAARNQFGGAAAVRVAVAEDVRTKLARELIEGGKDFVPVRD